MSPLQKRPPTQSPSNNPSLTSLARTQHPHRAFSFSSLRKLSKSSSRQTLRTLAAAPYPPPYSHGCSPPKNGNLKQTNVSQDTASSLPPDSGIQQSRGSSVESLPIDKSGISNDSTYATTPSPAKHRAFQELGSSSPVQRKSMGNKASTLLRKPIPFDRKQSTVTVTKDTKTPDGSSHQPASTGSQQPATFSARSSSVMVNVPRRRSSLTALHLDSSHFETPDPQHQNMQHRASTLTERRPRQSILAETIRPVTALIPSSPTNTTPTVQVQPRETLSPAFLSPPLLSPPLSNSQLSSASSQVPSPKSQGSTVPTYIHLPKTFPIGPVETPAPSLRIMHLKCYQSHRRMVFSRNKVCPVPCMTCKEKEGDSRWKCTWCALRVCGPCMAEFDAKRRNLEEFMAGREKGKKKESKESEGAGEVPELDGGNERMEVKKENALGSGTSQRQALQRQSSP